MVQPMDEPWKLDSFPGGDRGAGVPSKPRKTVTPEQMQEEYNRAVSYNQKCNGGNLYERVKQNEHFFVGNQWEGVNAPNLDKPVMNILKRVVSFFVSSIVSDDVGVELTLFGGKDEAKELELKIISQQVAEVIENTKAKAKNRDAIRDAAVDGDACFYLRFDPDMETGQAAMGGINIEVLPCTSVYFGNPQVWEVQEQPYLLFQMRKTLEDVQEEGRKNGIPEEILAGIGENEDPNSLNVETEDEKVTVLTRFWRDGGTVWFCREAGGIMVVPPTDTGYRLYPIAWMSWDKVKNSYHGQAAVTGLIPNQIFINKLFAMCMEHVKKLAFPKIVYDRRMFPNGYTNQVGEAVGVTGEPGTAARVIESADMSSQVMGLIETAMQYTRDTMGASDASLGNVKPDNTSAIIAVQKASAMPLELQRMGFYQFVEDYIRIFLDMMRVDYGIREVTYENENGESQRAFYDFSRIGRFRWKLNVNIGASTYWSELMQMQTLDNLFAQKVITDPADYLESVPSQYVPNKQKLLAKIREQQQVQQAGMMGQPAAMSPDGR